MKETNLMHFALDLPVQCVKPEPPVFYDERPACGQMVLDPRASSQRDVTQTATYSAAKTSVLW